MYTKRQREWADEAEVRQSVKSLKITDDDGPGTPPPLLRRESSDLEKYLEQPRRSSTKPGKKRRSILAKPKCCSECEAMLHTVVQGSGSTSYSRRFYIASALKSLHRVCPLCRLLLSVLHGSDGLVLEQILAYEDPTFNRADIMHGDVSTNVDDKVTITLQTLLRNPPATRRQPLASSRLAVVFDIKYRTNAIRGASAEKRSVGEDLAIFLCPGPPPSPNLPPPHISDDPRLDCNRKFELFHRWLWTDLGDRNPDSRRSRPTRLLDIIRDGYVQIVEGDTVMQNSDSQLSETTAPDYVALSHRWGASQHLTTTLSTIGEFREGISIERLPQTFKDAVFITNQLGFRYIWIDALCIIQDSFEDWQTESEKMGDIFKDAAVTLAVHCARDDSEGFLSDALAAPLAIECSIKGHTVGVCRPPSLELDVTNSRLSRRGWVLQERFLSTRTLHFTPGRVYFETTSKVLTEEGPLSVAPEASSHRRRYLDSRPTFFSPSASPQLRATFGLGVNGDVERGLEALQVTPLEWLDLVEMYSHCGLTKDKDKLMAISGMARKIHSQTHSHWCAGIWSDRLSEGLLWLPENTALSPPEQPRAPSWSWAAWDGAIQYPLSLRGPRFHSRCTFLSLNPPNHGGGEAGITWLNGLGCLTVRGRLVSLKDHRLGEAIQLGPGPPRKGPVTQGSADLPRLGLQHFVHAHRICAGTKNHTAGWIAFDSDEKSFLTGDNPSTPSPNSPARDMQPCFLILGTFGKALYLGIFIAVKKEEPHVYQRIGFGQMAHSAVLGVLPLMKMEVQPLPNEFFADWNLTTITLA
ncbi:heterokaryon incompatibility protein-domain-containing protein [Clohesyomyces aquaticus]|uniref:Heterokaryon incompatibility protein-domain-containing protein n=1 Tax=Clohesyomyces aquaticus TaxID=1231657 RepID=A0A1Y1ZIL0_9PLEO|nr:heterokaryon incompatibility protein-domain-containing protein [Clohesyomyces aquaticus]